MGGLLETLRAGGAVAYPLAIIGLVAWYMLTLRALSLRSGLRDTLDHALAVADRGERVAGEGVIASAVRLIGKPSADAALVELEGGLRAGRSTLRVLVAIAPLLGLLGTVSGMIETFASLADMTLHSRSGGVAGGISEALISTQLGLVVAIPALLAGRVLEQREATLAGQLAVVREHLRGAA